MKAAERWAATLKAGADAGLLAGPVEAPAEERPWPVVLLTAFGAWLAAVPLGAFVGMLTWELLVSGPGPYLFGLASLAAAVVLLRRRGLSLFVEQLAVPALLVGGTLLAFGLYRDAPIPVASLLLAAVAIGLAGVVRHAWLRNGLGALAASLVLLALLAPGSVTGRETWLRPWWAVHALAVAWLVVRGWQRVASSARAAEIESIGSGWLLVVLASLAALSGMTFLAGAAAGMPGWTGDGAPFDAVVSRVLSAALSAAAFAWLARQWPGTRRPVLALAAAVCVALAAAMPSLGGVLLLLAACAIDGRWRLAGAAGLAAAWIVGAFYYQLQMPFGTKALVLVLAGAVLGGIAWWMSSRRTAAAPAGPAAPRFALPTMLVPTAVVLCLVVANVGIWQKEAVIAKGRTVLVALAPVDPRSLMQGDYMALNFRLPAFAQAPRPADLPPHLVLQVNAGGVAEPLRIEAAGEEAPVMAPDEVRVALTAKDGRWVLVTDAWHFEEGQAERFAAARYGEFRVTDDGEALLVGLRDDRLVPIPK